MDKVFNNFLIYFYLVYTKMIKQYKLGMYHILNSD